MDKVVFFNVAWMKRYQGVVGDTPMGGGSYPRQHGFGGEIFNFQHFRDRMYGFVEAGWKPEPKCINITKLGARRADQSVSGILVIWVARHPENKKTLVVGWYENAKVYRERQRPPANSQRKQPDGQDAPYFVEAERENCLLIPDSMRGLRILRATEPRAGAYKAGGIGRSNIWYAQDPYGTQIKPQVLQYIAKWKAQKQLSVPI
jgi:5-methylcytosine-specific restriction protein A